MEDSKDVDQQPYVLTDLENLDHLQSPLKSTQRIKYTCFALSTRFLVFGATSGGLYIFKREPCTFLQLIPSKDGAVSRVAVSPDERVIAYATGKGLVVLVEPQAQGGGVARRLQVSHEHAGTQVTALQWSTKGDELYAADSLGRVSLCCVSLFTAKNIFQTPSLQLMQLDSGVVQLEYQDGLLLISTLSRCYISDTAKEQYKQVGQKLRDGEFGACFLSSSESLAPPPEHGETPSAPHVTSSNQFDLLGAHENLAHRDRNLRVFCARPGSRLWEVRSDGTVVSTHQFRQALVTTQPTELITDKKKLKKSKNINYIQDMTKQSFNFAKLYSISNKFIFTFKSNGIYIFDPDNAEILLWSNEFQDIIDAQVFDDTIYVWLATGEMHALTLCVIEKCIMRLYFRKHYALCAKLCSLHTSHLLKKLPLSRKLHFLVDLNDKLTDLGLAELQQKILPLTSEMSKIVAEKSKTHKLRSGIYLVGNNHVYDSDEEDGKIGLRIFRSISGSRQRKVSERSRSLSSSPDGWRRRKSGPKRHAVHDLSRQTHSGSLHSLPDISQHTTPVRIKPDDKLPVQSNETGHKKTEDWESKYVTSDDLFNVAELPFTVLSSPETIAALRDLTQSLSVKLTSGTKSLRKTWSALEGKVRSLSQEAPPAPLDVRPKDYQETHDEHQQLEDQEFEILLPNGKPVHLKKQEKTSEIKSLPKLDIIKVKELCNQIRNTPLGQDTQYTQEQLFNELNIVCGQFVACSLKEEENNHWFEKCDSEPFPFTHYFTADDIKVIQESLHNQLLTRNIVKILDEWITKIECDPNYPNILRTIYSDDELKIDTLLSRIISMYSNILDEDIILTYVKKLNIPCYFMTWCVILNTFQQNVLNFITTESRENIRKLISNQKYPLPMLLNVMYLILRVSSIDGINICLAIGENVSIKDFCYVIIKLQEHKINSETSYEHIQRYCQNIFLTYLTKLINNGKDIALECFSDKEVFEYISFAFLSLNNHGDQMCSCGYPKVQALRKVPLQFEHIGSLLLNHIKDFDYESYLLLCSKLGLWRKFLEYKQETGGNILPYLVQLDSPILLEELCLGLSEALWCELLQMKRSVEMTQLCLNCGTALERRQDWGLTWSHLGHSLIRVLGPVQACDILLRHMPADTTGGLDAQFYQACLFSTMVSDYGEASTKGVLNLLLRPSKEPPALYAPQVSGAISEALSRDLALQGCSGMEVLAPAGSDHHWGVQTQLRGSLCPRCTLPLSDPVLLKQGGLRVFPCSHTYHSACLPKLSPACMLCNTKLQ